jgi:hypothetical protein
VKSRQFVALPIRVGNAFETQSGLQLNAPRVFGVLIGPANSRRVGVLMHPASNMMNHYLIDALVDRGVAVLALNSRYCGGDQTLIMEHVIHDLGAGVRFLREKGFAQIILLGNSGGASLMAFYQAQAEKLTITQTPAGDPVNLTAMDLPAAEGIVLLAGHPGRSRLMQSYIDAASIDERNPDATDASLDIYNRANGPPFTNAFVGALRDAQCARIERITTWVQRRLQYLRAIPDGPTDEAFIVHRTYADPRFVDLTLDPSDREAGGNRGSSPREANLSANNLGRFSTLTSWLSQWSPLSQADGPTNLARTSCPVLQLEYTADGGVFPSDMALWDVAGGTRIETERIIGASHYLYRQPAQLNRVGCLVTQWMNQL